jgi:hypothetical protein
MTRSAAAAKGVARLHASPIVAEPQARRPFERAQDVGCAAAGRNAYYDVVFAELELSDCCRAGSPVVFSAFHGVTQSDFSARDQSLCHPVGHAEGWPQLGRVQDCQSARSPGTYVDQPPSCF